MTQAVQTGPPRGTGQTFHTPEPTARDYVRVVITRRWLVLSAFLVVMLAAAVWVFTSTPIYRSVALLQIAPGKPTIVPFQQVYDDRGSASGPQHDFLETQMKLIGEERLAQRTFNH